VVIALININLIKSGWWFIPYINMYEMENKIHVPNHQPDIVVFRKIRISRDVRLFWAHWARTPATERTRPSEASPKPPVEGRTCRHQKMVRKFEDDHLQDDE
jgi:hypothetical protein